MNRCFRCGVDFDGSAFIASAPCPDCQEYYPDEIWTRGFPKHNHISQEVLDARAEAIRVRTARKMSAPQIANELGITTRTVVRYRTKYEMEVPYLVGYDFIKDKSEHKRKAQEAAAYARAVLQSRKSA